MKKWIFPWLQGFKTRGSPFPVLLAEAFGTLISKAFHGDLLKGFRVDYEGLMVSHL